MSGLSTMRLTLLRGMYGFIAAGLAVTRWPELLERPADLSHMDTVVGSMLGAVSLLALLGIRYPLGMLPLLFFELLWKAMWVLMWGVPLWLDGRLDAARQETLIACLVGVVLVPIAMPWRYVVARYVRATGEPWRGATVPGPPPQSLPVSRLPTGPGS